MVALSITMAGVLAGCVGESTAPKGINDEGTESTPSIVGTWSLRTLNGSNLPFMIAQDGSFKIEIVSDILTVAAGSTFTEIRTLRSSDDGAAATEEYSDAGSYSISGKAVIFTFQSGSLPFKGTLNGHTLTLVLDGQQYVYQKQGF
jgi:hypothetical protein